MNDFTETDLMANAVVKKQYKVRVAGENALGIGEWSDWSSLTLPPKGYALAVVDAVASLQRHVHSPERTKLKLQWLKFTHNDAQKLGGDVAANIRYHVKSCVQPCADEDVTLVAGGNDLTDDEFEIQGLVDNYDYLIHAHATNSNGVMSTATSITLTVGTLPDAPSSTSINVTGGSLAYPTQLWDAPVNNGGSPIIAFEISRSTDSGNWRTIAPHLTSYQWQSIPTTQTTFKVRAKTKVGFGAEASVDANLQTP